MKPSLSTKAAAIRKQRGKQYGMAPDFNMAQQGKIWAGLLSIHLQKDIPPLPPHIVSLMMVACKCARASSPAKYLEDNYIDALNYLDFAAEAQGK